MSSVYFLYGLHNNTTEDSLSALNLRHCFFHVRNLRLSRRYCKPHKLNFSFGSLTGVSVCQLPATSLRDCLWLTLGTFTWWHVPTLQVFWNPSRSIEKRKSATVSLGKTTTYSNLPGTQTVKSSFLSPPKMSVFSPPQPLLWCALIFATSLQKLGFI